MKARASCTCDAESILTRLEEGLELDIFITRDDGSVYKEGRGVLLRKIKEVGEPYPYATDCKAHNVDDGVVNVIKEMWVIVRTDDPFLKGQEFVRNFERYHSTGLISTTCRYEDPEIDFIMDFCFSELDGDQRLCEDLKEEIEGTREKTILYKNYITFLNKFK